MSDHGFSSFKRSVNLNSWLYENGYLAVKDQPTGEEWFRDVDWSRSQAFAVGLGGIYLNVAGREAQGIVPPAEAQAVKDEIIAKLSVLTDPESGAQAIRGVYDTKKIYRGPYADEGPDLIVGFARGYRVSWTSVTGAVAPSVFEDNVKSWSGDHCLNPPDVPGIFFCNRKIQADKVSIMDVGPTVLDLFGVPVPEQCDGRSLMPAESGGQA